MVMWHLECQDFGLKMPNHLPAPLKVAAKIELGKKLPVAFPFNVNYDG